MLFTQVEYLGSVPLSRHSSDLMSLQDPLKELYFKYLEARQCGGVGLNGQAPSLPGTVEISKTGLKVGTTSKESHTKHNNSIDSRIVRRVYCKENNHGRTKGGNFGFHSPVKCTFL